MRKAIVCYKDERAGILTQEHRRCFRFRYDDLWFNDPRKPPISVTLPKTHQEYQADHLFPCFYHILSEGENKALQCRVLKIDEHDHFGLLLATAHTETIGALTVCPVGSAFQS